MKNLSILSFSVLLIALIVSCGQEPRELVIGEWKIQNIGTTGDIPEDIKDAQLAAIEEMKASYLLVFKADSTFDHSIAETTSKGKWQLSADAKSLTLIYEDGTSETSTVLELTSDKMVTANELNGIKNTITFEKQAKK